MKTAMLAPVALVAVLASSAVPAIAGSAGAPIPRPVVACANSELEQVSFRPTPSRCIFIQRNESAAFATAPTGSMEWRDWGRRKATGKGTGFVSMLGATPIRVRLSKLVNKCGHQVYSKVEVTYPELDEGGDFRLDACRR